MSAPEGLVEEPWRHDLFAVLRRFEREAPQKPRIGAANRLADEIVVLGQPPDMKFPTETLASYEPREGRAPKLSARFLGLFGPQGALPLETTEEAYDWSRSGDPAFAEFADILQSRFLALFYRAWADARPIAQNDRPDDDRFRDYLSALIGLQNPSLRTSDTLPEASKIGFAGLLSPRVKSASRLRAFLQGLFETNVEIEEFVGAWLPIDASDRSRLGAVNSGLGGDLLLGSRVFSVSDKIRVRLYTRDLDHYQTFLPGSPTAEKLADAVYVYLGFEFDWDLELAIPAGEIRASRLGEGARLGWTSWMAPNWASDDRKWRMDAKFDLAGRVAAARARQR